MTSDLSSSPDETNFSEDDDPDTTVQSSKPKSKTDVHSEDSQFTTPEATFISAEPGAEESAGKPIDIAKFDQWSVAAGGDADPGETMRAPREHTSLDLEHGESVILTGAESDDVTIAAKEAGFSIGGILGQGGMGTVYSGEQRSMNRPVAIKVLKADIANAADNHRMFVSEAIITGSLDHPNIVPIYDVGGRNENAPFYAMKQIEGVEWADRFESNSVEDNLDILLRVCDAIAFAHERGIIHRDLKPANVMLGPFGEVLVMDWGLAIPAPDHPRRKDFPQPSLGGTPYYMAPEMVLDVATIDRRSDVYLLGGILFAMVTGKAPHAVDDPHNDLRDRVTGTFEAVSANVIASTEKFGELIEIALKALETDPSDRYQNVAEFQKAIRDYLSHEESIELAGKSLERLDEAREQRDYIAFSRARFGFETALEEWPQNERAAKGLKATCVAYAETAREHGDFELALSLLDHSDPDQNELRSSIEADMAERNARQRQLKLLKRVSISAFGLVAIVASVAAVWINGERAKALDAQTAESEQRAKAIHAKLLAETSAQDAIAAQLAAEQSEQDAVAARVIAERKERVAKRDRARFQRQAYLSDMLLLTKNAAEFNPLQMRAILGRHTRREDLHGFEFGYWRRQLHMAYAQSQRTGVTRCLDFSPDGTTLAAGRGDKIILFNTHDLRRPRVLSGHVGSVYGITFSPDGRRIASGGQDRVVHIWDALTGVETNSFAGHTGSCTHVDFSPDGLRLASVGSDNSGRVWDSVTGDLISTFIGSKAGLRGVSFHPDGSRIAAAGDDGKVYVWDAGSGEKRIAFQTFGQPVYRVRFSHDGTLLATALQNGELKIWEASSGKERLSLSGHSNAIRDVRFSLDDTLVVSTGLDRTSRVWGLRDGNVRQVLFGHDSAVHAAAISPDGTLIATADDTVRLWHADQDMSARHIPLPKTTAMAIAFTPDGSHIARGSRDGVLTIVDFGSGQPVYERKEFARPIQDIEFSPDGRMLAVSSSDMIDDYFHDNEPGLVKIWKLEDAPEKFSLLEPTEFAEFPKGLRGISFSPDSSRLATANFDRTISIFDSESGQKLFNFAEQTEPVMNVRFGPNGKTLLSAGCDFKAHLWNVETQKETAVQGEDQVWINAAAISPDGTQYALGNWFGKVTVWDRATGERRFSQVAHTGKVSGLSFTPDGKRLASASEDGSLKLWDSKTGQETMSLTWDRSISDLAFSPDGQLLAVSLPDGIEVLNAAANDKQQRNEDRARAYVAVHSEEAKSLEGLRAKIRVDATINDTVRQQSFDWSELYWNAQSKK